MYVPNMYMYVSYIMHRTWAYHVYMYVPAIYTYTYMTHICTVRVPNMSAHVYMHMYMHCHVHSRVHVRASCTCTCRLRCSLNADYNLTATCNARCTCEDLPYSPVCGPDNLQYFSPCHAGCLDVIETDSGDIVRALAAVLSSAVEILCLNQ